MEAGAVLKRVATTLVIAAIAGSLTFGIFYFFPFLGTAERWTRDFRIANLSPPEPQHPDIVVAAITEETLSAFPYRSPVDRKFLADTIRIVAEKGAKAILIDVLFDQETEEEKDDALREALADLKIPFSISYSDSPTYVTDEQLAYLDDFVKPAWRGLADIEPDKTDGIIRFVPPPRTVKDGTYVPNVAARVAQLLGAKIPDKQSIIAWRGEPDSATQPFREFPSHAVRVLPETWFRDKIVLVGANLSLTDRYRTPFSIGRDVGDNRMAGIVIQAHILAQMLEGRVAPEDRAFVPHLVTLAILALIGAALGSTGVPIWARLGGATLAVVLMWAAGWYLFKANHPFVPLVEALTGGRNLLVPLIEPIVALGLSLWLSDAWSGRAERQQKKFIQGVFSKYVSAELLNEIVKDPKKLDLSASRRPMSLIFTDVQGFTTLSEKLEAAHLADVLNRYLDGGCREIWKYGGTINQFTGDAIYAMFNAPREQPDHAKLALKAALDIDAFSEVFRAGERAKGVDMGMTRIGVHTAEANVGNFGSLDRYEYKALGDAVNTAARLEGLNKYFGTRILITQQTRDASPEIPCRKVGGVIVKGKSEPIHVYEPLTGERATDENTKLYLAAFELMKAKDPGALAAFEDLCRRYPDDALAEYHLDRLRAGETGEVFAMAEK
ncbi:MAG: adenylate/guanylate cyclase domain-containing protein [Rhodospirillales bacterium]|nr:adenylate/guanylate cyclase domain-containing protein [Rhodospirillales bacterium]